MTTSKNIPFLLYHTPQEDIRIQALINDNTLWLSQKAMGTLFDVDRSVITKHLRNIFDEGELEEEAVCAKFAHTAEDGKTYPTNFYSLDAIISVGYRVNSRKATLFRQWATQVLNEYIRKGFVLDDDRLKQGDRVFGKDFFRELLDRVRSIRASERRIWQQITDIYAECSIDYDPKAKTTKEFYAMIQNCFHYAITGKTAAEIIYSSTDHSRQHMGLQTWKHAPEGRILRSDTTVAKNYLSEKDIRSLERAVTGFFDYIEDLIERENSFSMQEFSESVSAFLTFRRYKILQGKGSISHQQAVEKAHSEYDIFNRTQPILSDFDKQVQQLYLLSSYSAGTEKGEKAERRATEGEEGKP